MNKGDATKANIVRVALRLATKVGLNGLSIGLVAEAAEMSKSGVFAHFGSREDLQISVVREYHRMFEQEVFKPAMAARRGLPRLVALFDNWLQRSAVEVDAGCIYISGAVEFENHLGLVRDTLVWSFTTWLAAVEQAIGQAIEEGHLNPSTDVRELQFQLHGLVLAMHYEARFLKMADQARGALPGATLAHRAFIRTLHPLLSPAGLQLL